jgi:hypothetical protein
MRDVRKNESSKEGMHYEKHPACGKMVVHKLTQ